MAVIETSLQDPTSIVNAALVKCGHTDRIGDLFDGSNLSSAALAVYGQTRDNMMRKYDPGFAQKSDSLTLLKSAPAGGYGPWAPWNPTDYPPVQWLYEYAYPSDCLRIRALLAQRIFVPNFSPTRVEFREFDDDTLTPAAKVIGCNVPNAMIVYTGRITNPALWEPTFTQVLIDGLAEAIGPAVASATREGLAVEAAAAQKGAGEENQDIVWQG